MSDAAQDETSLPANVKPGLERFQAALLEALGDQLVSVVLYGSIAKGEYNPSGSNVNVMVVLDNVTVDVLDKLVTPIRKARREFRLSPLVLSEEDLRTSTDVFPAKFLDMQQHHRVLSGKEVLADLPIARDHLRLRCEQEIKNLLLRLRAFYLNRSHRTPLIRNTLSSAISAFLNNLSTLLVLKTGKSPVRETEIADAAAAEFDLDGQLLQRLLALKGGDSKAHVTELKGLYNSLMTTVQRVARVVDQL